jgi:hypothetical protein
MLGKEPLVGNLDFQALPQKNQPSNPGRPSKGFPSPIHCRYKRFDFLSNPKRRMVDPQQEILFQKMNTKD